MRKFSAKQKLAVVIGAGAIAVAASGTAYAFWTSGGSGSGSASTGTTDDTKVVVNQTAIPAGTLLYPGMITPITLSGTFTNTNSGPVKVGTVTAVLDTATLPSGCVATDFTVGGSAPVNAEIPVGTGGTWTGVTIIMNDTAVNQDSCKTKTIPLIYTVTAGS